MAGTDGPTVQEADYLRAVNSGQQADPSTGGSAPAPDTSGQVAAMRDMIAQTMMARSQGGGRWWRW